MNNSICITVRGGSEGGGITSFAVLGNKLLSLNLPTNCQQLNWTVARLSLCDNGYDAIIVHVILCM